MRCGAHRVQRQKAVHIQLHQAKNEQPQGEKLQNRVAWIDTNFIESFDCHLIVLRPVLIAKSKGERSFEVHQVEPQERRRSARKHFVDSQPPKIRRNMLESHLSIKHETWRALFVSFPLRYIPQRRVLSEASKTKSERHQNWQHFDRILESMTSEYETKWSQPLHPFILRMCSASLTSR